MCHDVGNSKDGNSTDIVNKSYLHSKQSACFFFENLKEIKGQKKQVFNILKNIFTFNIQNT
jgi:hypothetical protein